MQRAGGMSTRMAGGARRAHICAECGKSFRTGEDLFMHAEVCLLDAFEIEATAVRTETGGSRRSQGDSNKRALVPDAGYASAPKQDSIRQGVDVVSKRPTDIGEVQAANDSAGVNQYDDDELVESDDDYEPPPELELAEPPQKKYRRTFPIGEDGKQIRPKMECPTCGLVLYRHNFSTHFRIHTGELPFQCSFCDKRFRTSSALTVHTRCHTGERPYECPHCNYCCITKRNLDRHIINNHVKKSSRTGRLSREYYAPRTTRRSNPTFGLTASGQLNLDYGDEIDDETLEDEIDDENLDEAELEEEAGISRNVTTETTQGEPLLSTTGAAAANTESADATPSKQGQPSDTSLKRGGVKTIPILDGPKGVYGDPEAEAEETSGQASTKKKSTTSEKQTEAAAGNKESQAQDASS